MDAKLNSKPELGINFSDLPPGSYIIKDGKILPNLDDEAMLKRSKLKDDDKKNDPAPDKSDIKKENKN